MRIATFNVENLDDEPIPADRLKYDAPFEERAPILRAQLTRLRADILCLQEVNAQKTGTEESEDRSFRALDRLLEGTAYERYDRVSIVTTAGDPYAERNLVTLIRPGLVFRSHRQILHDFAPRPQYDFQTDVPDAGPRTIEWERPLLHAEIALEDDSVLHVINAHLKSKLPTNVPGQKIDRFTWRSAGAWAEGFFVSSMKRVGAAIEARKFIDTLIDADADARVVICGDLNAEPGEVPIQALQGEVGDTQNPALLPYVMFPCSHTVPEDSRFTLYHHGRKNLLDHMLVSRALIAQYRTAEIHNEIVRDESVQYAFDRRYPSSDHAPFVAEFAL